MNFNWEFEQYSPKQEFKIILLKILSNVTKIVFYTFLISFLLLGMAIVTYLIMRGFK